MSLSDSGEASKALRGRMMIIWSQLVAPMMLKDDEDVGMRQPAVLELNHVQVRNHTPKDANRLQLMHVAALRA